MMMTEREIMSRRASDMKSFIKNRVTHIRVQTECGTAVRVSKKEALAMIDRLNRRNALPKLNCAEISPLKYLAIVEKANDNEAGVIFID